MSNFPKPKPLPNFSSKPGVVILGFKPNHDSPLKNIPILVSAFLNRTNFRTVLLRGARRLTGEPINKSKFRATILNDKQLRYQINMAFSTCKECKS